MDAEVDERRIPARAELEAFCENGRLALEQYQTEALVEAALELEGPIASDSQNVEWQPEEQHAEDPVHGEVIREPDAVPLRVQRRRWADMTSSDEEGEDPLWPAVPSSSQQSAVRETAMSQPQGPPAATPRVQRRRWADMEGENDLWSTVFSSRQSPSHDTVSASAQPSSLPEGPIRAAASTELHLSEARRPAELHSETRRCPEPSASPSASRRAERCRSSACSVPRWIPNPIGLPPTPAPQPLQPPVPQPPALPPKQLPATTRCATCKCNLARSSFSRKAWRRARDTSGGEDSSAAYCAQCNESSQRLTSSSTNFASCLVAGAGSQDQKRRRRRPAGRGNRNGAPWL